MGPEIGCSTILRSLYKFVFSPSSEGAQICAEFNINRNAASLTNFILLFYKGTSLKLRSALICCLMFIQSHPSVVKVWKQKVGLSCHSLHPAGNSQYISSESTVDCDVCADIPAERMDLISHDLLCFAHRQCTAQIQAECLVAARDFLALSWQLFPACCCPWQHRAAHTSPPRLKKERVGFAAAPCNVVHLSASIVRSFILLNLPSMLIYQAWAFTIFFTRKMSVFKRKAFGPSF